jgi:myosin heavy subunit
MAIETVPMDDKELFSAAIADEAPAAVETPEPAEVATEADTGQPRDEHGRFAPKTEAPQADAAPIQQPATVAETPKDDEAGNVPSWRLRELREERDALRRQHEETTRTAYAYQQQMAEMQQRLADLQKPKQEPVDFFADPSAAFKQQVAPLEQQFQQLQAETRMANSKAIAIARHGVAAVDELEKAVAEAIRANDPNINTLRSQLATSHDPVGTAMEWYSGQKVMKETGGDIAKFKDKILADAMKDPTFQAKVIEAARGQAASGQRPNIQLPPSLNKTAGSGGSTTDLTDADMSDRALFQHAVQGGRR